MTLIRDLLDLPASVRKGDFVLSLNQGIEHPEATVQAYAVTPNLLASFDQVMAVIDSALTSGRSQAVYLHGSFGSGKSHFMAVLDLMLAGHPAPWQRTEIHPLRERYSWVGKSKLLRLPLHMVGAASMEEKIFGAYVAYVQSHHPDADIPALFADGALFHNARTQRENMGDEKFFEVLNRAAPTPKAGWGKLAAQAAWTPERFDEVAGSSDPKQRAGLFSSLVKTHFPAFAGQTQTFIELDGGLGVMSRHAAQLGYQAVVLYLDELILWLAGHFADLSWVQNEAQKIAKLKEAQDERRDVPIVSFIARQRDLSEMVGDDAVGAERLTLRDSIEFHSGRIETVTLEDRNLPWIIERRVLRAKSDTARATIDDGFVTMQRGASASWAALLGSYADEKDFRRVYPFSPALVEVLVALSDCLQRERTAIRILMELLVDHLTDLQLGQVVPVGEIYDVIAGGEDAFDSQMKERFERAKHLYAHHLLPLVHAANNTGTRERCQRLRDDHTARLGCSGCAERACRNDNRLAKTLLLAALVPNAGPFKDLSVKRLVQLNHGTVSTPIPGTEVQLAADKLRKWASQVGQLRIGDDGDPRVFLRLEGVDLKPILDGAQEANTAGARKRMLQSLLFSALELPPASNLATETLLWQGTKRPGTVRFGNVRELSDGHLCCPAGSEWYVIVDYPFDEPGKTPEDDLQRITAFRDEQVADNTTFVWLPTFFSDKLERELGELCVVDHVLTGDNARKALAYLRPEDQTRARQDLDSLRNQKRELIKRALGQAYGITSGRDEGILDPSRSVEEHVVSLQPGLEGRPLLAGSFRHALVQLAERLLEHRYPHHRAFEGPVTSGKLDKVRAHVERLLEQPDHRMPIGAAEHKELRGYATPLELVVLGETVAELKATRLQEIEQQRLRAGVETPTVDQVRTYVDPDGRRGLVPEASDLMVWVYSAWSGRTLERGGRSVEPVKLGKLPDDAELVKPDLPSSTEWHGALAKAGELFGITLAGKALHARNLGAFAADLDAALGKAEAARGLQAALAKVLADGWGPAGDPAPARLLTAQSGADLLKLAAKSGLSTADRVRQLAAFQPVTSAAALARSLRTARDVLAVLGREAEWMVFRAVQGFKNDPTRQGRAQVILDDLAEALAADQLNVDLPQMIAALVRAARDLSEKAGGTKVPSKPPPAGWQEVGKVEQTVALGRDRKSIQQTLRQLATSWEERAAALSDDDAQAELELDVHLVFRRRRGDGGGER